MGALCSQRFSSQLRRWKPGLSFGLNQMREKVRSVGEIEPTVVVSVTGIRVSADKTVGCDGHVFLIKE